MDAKTQPPKSASITAQAARSKTVMDDLPDEREYERSVDQTLDAVLLNAIVAADAAGNTTLATVLRFELGSHYLDCQR